MSYVFYICQVSTSAKTGGTCALNLPQWMHFVPYFSISSDMTMHIWFLADVLIEDI